MQNAPPAVLIIIIISSNYVDLVAAATPGNYAANGLALHYFGIKISARR